MGGISDFHAFSGMSGDMTVGALVDAGADPAVVIVILHGQAEVLIEGREKQSFNAPAFAYIPPNTRHNVSNSGKEILEYVYVVATAVRR